MSLRQIDIHECHKYLLQIANSFDSICKRNGIPYYMLGGTMLGAIRHKGFIPWDDDMDFGIPRPFFQPFLEIANRELPEELQIVSRHNSPSVKKGFIKIQLKGSRLIESVFGEQAETFYNGIAIDVFPLDGADTNSLSGQLTNQIAFLLQRLHEARYCTLEIRKGLKKILTILLKNLPINDEKLADFIDRIIQKEAYESSDKVANFYGHWKSREIIDKKIFGEPVDYSFEEIRLSGVQNYDAYLKSLYGNYMQLPPKEQQLVHAGQIFVDTAIHPYTD